VSVPIFEVSVELPKTEDLIDSGDAREQLKLSKLRADLAHWKRVSRNTQDELATADARIEVLLDTKKVSKPVKVRKRAKAGKSQSTAVLVASDWHVEEEVLPEQVNDLNRFNLEIAEERIEKFWRNGLVLVDSVRGATQVNDLVLLLLGDFYSGHIHEDLVEITSKSPIESIMWLQPQLVRGIDYLLEEGGFAKLHIVGKIGNHSRLTRKPRVATAEKHSLEWLMYHNLAQHYADEPRVVFTLEPSYHTILDLYGYRVRVHHGDWLRYAGGIGGLSVPLNKAILQWNRGLPVDLDVMGHWHSWTASIGRAIVNGSLIGHNPFGIKIKAEFEPPQQGFFLVSEKYGRETLRAPVFVE